ncbi:hypothetical protein GCM10007047_30740 [Cerasicoccus arenae]|uniref:POTRA domain-containing protein n=2 Tax=Cerasicoccus arenae TaxID=424488 RepID=A0A8J3GE38_9BACT|nr:hypothetical protein GCM10007047_30740 [Cerasicoccus arenae]
MINLKFLGGLITFALLSCAIWGGVKYLRSESFSRLMAGGSERMRAVYLETDGVLDEQWLNQQVSLPENIELMAVDIEAIQRTLRDNGQVRSVLVERVFPDALRIRIAERQPVLRMVLQDSSGKKFMRLISYEGDIYPGQRYPADTIRGLPYVAGVTLHRKENGDYQPLDGIGDVADFLHHARRLMPDRVSEWESVSLADFDPSGKTLSSRLAVTTSKGYTIVFSPNDLDEQFAELETILKQLERQRQRFDHIDLSMQDAVVKLAEATPRGPVRFR